MPRQNQRDFRLNNYHLAKLLRWLRPYGINRSPAQRLKLQLATIAQDINTIIAIRYGKICRILAPASYLPKLTADQIPAVRHAVDATHEYRVFAAIWKFKINALRWHERF